MKKKKNTFDGDFSSVPRRRNDRTDTACVATTAMAAARQCSIQTRKNIDIYRLCISGNFVRIIKSFSTTREFRNFELRTHEHGRSDNARPRRHTRAAHRRRGRKNKLKNLIGFKEQKTRKEFSGRARKTRIQWRVQKLFIHLLNFITLKQAIWLKCNQITMYYKNVRSLMMKYVLKNKKIIIRNILKSSTYQQNEKKSINNNKEKYLKWVCLQK